MQDPGMQQVACGIMYDNQGKILMGLRAAGSEQGGFWEFPGGKCEDGETIEQCLVREWSEELNLTIHISREIYRHVEEDKYVCRFFIGRILDQEKMKMRVHEQLRFVNRNEMEGLNMFPGDKHLLNIL